MLTRSRGPSAGTGGSQLQSTENPVARIVLSRAEGWRRAKGFVSERRWDNGDGASRWTSGSP